MAKEKQKRSLDHALQVSLFTQEGDTLTGFCASLLDLPEEPEEEVRGLQTRVDELKGQIDRLNDERSERAQKAVWKMEKVCQRCKSRVDETSES